MCGELLIFDTNEQFATHRSTGGYLSTAIPRSYVGGARTHKMAAFRPPSSTLPGARWLSANLRPSFSP